MKRVSKGCRDVMHYFYRLIDSTDRANSLAPTRVSTALSGSSSRYRSLSLYTARASATRAR